jgi:putative sigma-54 modulation protein
MGMKIEISSKNFDLTPSITQYIEDKLGLIAKHIQKFELEGDLHLKVQVGRTTEHHNKGEVYEAVVDLPMPGTNLRAADSSEDLRAAIDVVRNNLEREIEKYKAKHS